MYKIRVATVDDIEVLEKAALDYSNLMNRGKEMVNLDYALEEVVPSLLCQGLLLLCEDGDKPVGLVGSVVTHSVFNCNLPILCEMFWWTDQEYRERGVGTSLLVALEEKARELEIDTISLAMLDTSPEIDEWLRRKGFSLREKSYLRVI